MSHYILKVCHRIKAGTSFISNWLKILGPLEPLALLFLIPIFAFILDERVTLRMWIATGIILLGMSLITGLSRNGVDSFSIQESQTSL